MKKLLTLITSICLWQISFSQTVPLDSVQFYEGKTITVCSKVQSTYLTKGDKKTTYINFGQPYPNTTFTVVIFEGNLTNFKYTPSVFLKDKNVCITGKVKIYKGKPEIIVSKEEQINIAPELDHKE
jgi:DNA/RNA endonuclease YhcR with UshA esterase domain